MKDTFDSTKILYGFIVYFILGVLGMLSGKVIDNVSIYKTIMYSLGFTLFTLNIFFFLLVSRKYYKLFDPEKLPGLSELKHEVSRMQEALSKCKFENSAAKTFVLRTADLSAFEETIGAVPNSEVLIMTPEMSVDLAQPLYSTIKDNISKGVKYCYVLPNIHAVAGQFENLKNKLKTDISGLSDLQLAELLKVEYLPEKFIVSGITLYLTQAKGFVNIPHRDYEKEFFVPMDDYFFGRTKNCINALVAYHKNS